jgi:ABC-type nitrate/sulfonate/bicarbonate transport system substrate-binding protein
MPKVFVALLTIFLLHVSVHATEKIRVATPDVGGQFLTLPLAQRRGFVKEEGLEVEIITMRPDTTVAALRNGDVDYATGIGRVVQGVIQGLPLKVVACYAPSSTQTIISRAEIKSVKELKGQTIGINNYGGAVELITRMILKQFGLDPDKDVKFVALGGAGPRFAALKQGLIAAAVVSPPLDSEGKKVGFNVIARAYELFSFPQAGLGVHVKKLQEKPNEVKRVIKAGIKANRYIRADPEGTIEVMMGWLRLNKQIATATYESTSKAFNDDGSVPEDGLHLILETNKTQMKIERGISLSDVVDLSILKEAQRELGINGK